MTIEDKRERIKWYCSDAINCENCALSNDDAPGLSNCFTHASDEEVEINYSYLLQKGEI